MTSSPSLPVAYPLLNQLLDSVLPFPVSSTSSTFTLPTVATTSPSSSASSTAVSVIPSNVASVTSALSSSPISFSVNTSIVNTTASASTTSVSTPLPVLSSISSPVSSIKPPFFIHPKDAVATSPHFQQYSAVRQLTRDLQQKKPKHPRRPHLPSEIIQQPVRRLVHSVVYKQKLNQYITALKLYEKHLDELIEQTTFELDKINNTPPPFLNYENLKRLSPCNYPLSLFKFLLITAVIIIIVSLLIPSIVHMFHLTILCIHISPPPPPSPALIPIRVEAITPTFQPPSPLNDLDQLVTSLNDVD